jgi:hypothetical protein
MENNVSIRRATLPDLKFIIDIQRRFTDQIGFLPKCKTEKSIYFGNVFLGNINGQEAGFLLYEPKLSCQPTTAIIVQAAIRMDAQRQTVGLHLVKNLCNLAYYNDSTVIQASCREDLEANIFWKAAGFTAIATRPGGKRRNFNIIIWRKQLRLFANLYDLAVSKLARGPGGNFVRRSEENPTTLLLQR